MENDGNEKVQETTTEVRYKVKKKSKAVAIWIVAILVILVAGTLAYYFGIYTNPTNVYRRIVKNGAEIVFGADATVGHDKVNANVNLDLTLDMEQEELNESPMVQLVNKIDLGINTQIDNTSEQIVVKLKSTYDKEDLLNIAAFMDSKNQKIYLYVKEFIDKYLEIELEDYSSDITTENTKLETWRVISENKAKRILKTELAKVITEDMCFKGNGAYVLKTTNVQLLQNVKQALENLKTNKDFLACFENPDDVIVDINEVLETYDISDSDIELYTIELKIYTDILLTIEKVEITVIADSTITAAISFKDGITMFIVNRDNDKLFDGQMKTVSQGNIGEIDLSVNIPEVGNVNVKLSTSYILGKEIEKIDTAKVKKLEELTEDELMDAMASLQSSKLAEVFGMVSQMFMPDISYDESDTLYLDDEYVMY